MTDVDMALPPGVDAVATRCPDAGHPWTGEPGWEIAVLLAEEEADLSKAIEALAQDYWQVWLRGSDDVLDCPSAILYRPSNAARPWTCKPSLNGAKVELIWVA